MRRLRFLLLLLGICAVLPALAQTTVTGTVSFPFPVSLTLPSGLGIAWPGTTAGDLAIGGPTPTRLAGNAGVLRRLLCQSGDGSVVTSTAWCAIALADLPSGISAASSDHVIVGCPSGQAVVGMTQAWGLECAPAGSGGGISSNCTQGSSDACLQPTAVGVTALTLRALAGQTAPALAARRADGALALQVSPENTGTSAYTLGLGGGGAGLGADVGLTGALLLFHAGVPLVNLFSNQLLSTVAYCSGASISSGGDTCLSRLAAGKWGIGGGVGGSSGELQIQHVIAGGTAPTVSTCGTSPSITGGDLSIKVTVGTGAPAACTVTLNAAYPTEVNCSVWRTNGGAVKENSASASAITFAPASGNFTDSEVVRLVCTGF